MADFCQQCSREIFGQDTMDLAGSGAALFYTICEGCGPTVVDGAGRCVGDCDRHHGTRPRQTLDQFVKGELP